jgi:manganese/zinc/iron transport system permease protein
MVGTFMLLRKRSLVSDVVGHAALPGIGVAFILMELVKPGSGRSLTGLLVGAGVAGVAGILCTTGIRRFTKIKEDAAYAIVLSIFFGIGVALFTIIQSIPTGNAAGLNQFIFGKAASLRSEDVRLIAYGSLVVLAVLALFFKEFAFLCFDEESAAAQGLPVLALDLALMSLVVGVSVIGLQSVGLLLVVALVITPAAAARFWTHNLRRMTFLSAVFGAASAVLGVLTSAASPQIATGSIIVLFGAAIFLLSLLFGTERGVLRRWLEHRRLTRRVGRHDLLRAVYEEIEPELSNTRSPAPADIAGKSFAFDLLLRQRSWNARRLDRLLREAEREDLTHRLADDRFRLTPSGAAEALRVVREHRLWELYLITYADVAPGQVDRYADRIEHVLEPEVIEELTALLSTKYPQQTMPPSPHPIEQSLALPSTP